MAHFEPKAMPPSYHNASDSLVVLIDSSADFFEQIVGTFFCFQVIPAATQDFHDFLDIRMGFGFG